MPMPRALPGNVGAERQTHLRNYLVACIRDHFPAKADLVNPEALKRLKAALSSDLAGALAGIGLTPAAARELATEAVGGALAKRAVGWVMGKLGA